MMELYKHPQRDGQEVRSLTDSLVSREEEERHLRMVSENEQLKKQIAEVISPFLCVCVCVTLFMLRDNLVVIFIACFYSCN